MIEARSAARDLAGALRLVNGRHSASGGASGPWSVPVLTCSGLTGDGIGYVPLGGFLNLLLTAGLSQTNFGASNFIEKGYTQNGTAKTTRIATTLLSGSELDWRAGGGLSFALGEGYELHVVGRYEPLTLRGLSSYALSVDTGFNIDLN